MKLRLYTLIFFGLTLFSVWACKKDVTNLPPAKVNNPFDTIKDHTPFVVNPVIDSSSFLGIHTFIFAQKCARPGCHDGSFEPDYRTVESAYNTLVYAPVVKNTKDKKYRYRVVPDSSTHSWLYYRIITHDNVLGRMPLYADTLSASEIRHVKNWIDNGAKDILGNSPVYPSGAPGYSGFFAFMGDSSGARLDTIRDGNVVSAVLAPQNKIIDLWFIVYDPYATGFAKYIPPYAKVAFSTDPTNFKSATRYAMLVSSKYIVHKTVFGSQAGTFLHYKWNTAGYNTGDIIYVRTYLASSLTSTIFESPDGSTPYLVTYNSLKIK